MTPFFKKEILDTGLKITFFTNRTGQKLVENSVEYYKPGEPQKDY